MIQRIIAQSDEKCEICCVEVSRGAFCYERDGEIWCEDCQLQADAQNNNVTMDL